MVWTFPERPSPDRDTQPADDRAMLLAAAYQEAVAAGVDTMPLRELAAQFDTETRENFDRVRQAIDCLAQGRVALGQTAGDGGRVAARSPLHTNSTIKNYSASPWSTACHAGCAIRDHS